MEPFCLVDWTLALDAFAKKYDPKIRCFTIDIDGGEESGD